MTQIGDVIGVLDLPLDRLFLDLFDDLLRHGDGDVGADEYLFEFVIEIVAQFVAGKEHAQFARHVVLGLFQCGEKLTEQSHRFFCSLHEF